MKKTEFETGLELCNQLHGNIILKKIKAVDAEEVFSLVDRNRNYLRQWLAWLDYNKTIEDSIHFIQSATEQDEKGLGPTFGIWLENELVGIAGFHRIQKNNRSAEIGYWVSEKYSGKGIATQAASDLVDYGFQQLGLHRIELRCGTGNHASAKIAQKLNFTYEGTLRECENLYGHYISHFLYSKLKIE